MGVVRAGVVYAAVVFAAGFVLGTLRTLVFVPWLGGSAAVVLELPVILAISWIICGWVIRRCEIPIDGGVRLAMGGVALAVLLASEACLSVILFGRSFGQHLATYRYSGAQIGLAGQLLFALMPLIRARMLRL